MSTVFPPRAPWVYLVVSLTFAGGTAAAAATDPPTVTDPAASSAAASNTAAAEQTPPITIARIPVQPSFAPAPSDARRPSALVPLYVSLASLQVLDVASTYRALGNGGVEANPVMRQMVGSPAAVVAVKFGVTGLSIYACEKMWKRNRAAALLLMVGMNGAYSAIVAHNFAIGR